MEVTFTVGPDEKEKETALQRSEREQHRERGGAASTGPLSRDGSWPICEAVGKPVWLQPREQGRMARTGLGEMLSVQW